MVPPLSPERKEECYIKGRLQQYTIMVTVIRAHIQLQQDHGAHLQLHLETCMLMLLLELISNYIYRAKVLQPCFSFFFCIILRAYDASTAIVPLACRYVTLTVASVVKKKLVGYRKIVFKFHYCSEHLQIRYTKQPIIKIKL